MRMLPSTETPMRAVWRLERSSDTSLMAIASWSTPRALVAIMRNGVSDTRARLAEPCRQAAAR